MEEMSRIGFQKCSIMQLFFKEYPITVLSNQVCLLSFYLCCEAKGTGPIIGDEVPLNQVKGGSASPLEEQHSE